jgi:hypothetical protein
VTVTSLLPVRDDRAGRDQLEIVAALISAPSFDPLFRAEIIPERVYQLLQARQHKTITLFSTRHNRSPSPESVPGWRCSPPTSATATEAGR